MASSAFASPFRYFSNLLGSPNHPASDSNSKAAAFPETAISPSRTRVERPDLLISRPSSRASERIGHGKGKRKAVEEDEERPTKKRAMSEGRRDFIPYDDDDDDGVLSGFGSPVSPSFPDRITAPNADMDRTLMPPPATPLRSSMKPLLKPRLRPVAVRDSRAWTPDDDSTSYASTAVARKRMDDMDDEMMEDARRHAAAVTLPANSGIWSQTERELFFHLAYRGFEVLLPQNWMIDFDTLPLSLFAQEDTAEPPLIQNIRDNQFRAGHALRRLFEAGHDVRDRNHVSPGIRREKVLERCVKAYLYWALTDVGLRPTSDPSYVPVHVVVRRRKGRTTLQTLEEIARKLHNLSERHRRDRDVRPSIELVDPGTRASDETRIVEDDTSSPTLIGLVIISSVLNIVTLSPFTPTAPAASTIQTASPPSSDPSSRAETDFNPDRLRIIAELDFSQRDQDVWNALGVAIVAMQIRRETLKVNYGFTYDDIGAMDWDGMSMAGSRFEDDLEGTSIMSRLDLNDDPDL